MNARVTLISFLAGVAALAQVPRTDPVFPTPPVRGVDPGPQGLTNFGQTNIFTGPPGPRFTNSALARMTNGFTNGFFRFTNEFGMVTNFFLTNGVGTAPGQTNTMRGGFTNAPFAPAAPATLPTLPGTTPVVPGVPPANPGSTPVVPNNGDGVIEIDGTTPGTPRDGSILGTPGTPSAIGEPAPGKIPPRVNPRNTPVRIPQQPATPAPAPAGR